MEGGRGLCLFRRVRFSVFSRNQNHIISFWTSYENPVFFFKFYQNFFLENYYFSAFFMSLTRYKRFSITFGDRNKKKKQQKNLPPLLSHKSWLNCRLLKKNYWTRSVHALKRRLHKTAESLNYSIKIVVVFILYVISKTACVLNYKPFKMEIWIDFDIS